MLTAKSEEHRRTAQFVAVTEHFSSLARREGVTVAPFAGAAPRYFPQLPAAMQDRVLQTFSDYVATCDAVVAEGASLWEENVFLWRMFRTLGVVPSSDLMSRLGPQENQIIEIYNGDFVQVYRNLSFFRLCSYSLDELLCRPFWELFFRDETVTSRIVAVAGEYFARKREEVYFWDLERHTVGEIAGPLKYRLVVEQKLVAPLLDSSGQIVALLNVLKVISTFSESRAPQEFVASEESLPL